MGAPLTMPTTADIVARATQLFDDLNFNAAREWKAAKPGRKVVGFMPIYVPREIIHAADMLPLGIVGGGGKSPGERALAMLQKEMPDYSKSDRTIFEKLAPRMDVALKNARKLCDHNRQSDSDNPSTGVHELVEYLIGLKR